MPLAPGSPEAPIALSRWRCVMGFGGGLGLPQAHTATTAASAGSTETRARHRTSRFTSHLSRSYRSASTWSCSVESFMILSLRVVAGRRIVTVSPFLRSSSPRPRGEATEMWPLSMSIASGMTSS
jgi:hypothetical protein